MTTFLLTILIVLLAGVGLGIGVIAGRKPIGGSCGGLGALGLECDAGCNKPCPRRRAREQARHED